MQQSLLDDASIPSVPIVPPPGLTLLQKLEGHMGGVWRARWSPDGMRLASSGSYESTVKVWDTTTGKALYTLKGSASMVSAITIGWLLEGKQLVSYSGDGTVWAWDTMTGMDTLKGHTNASYEVEWSPDGRQLALGADDGTVQIWDVMTGRKLYSLKGHMSEVYDVRWSPDGQQLASYSGDRTVRVWDATTSKELHRLEDGAGWFYTRWSPDGKRLVSGSYDGRVLVWDATTGKELYRLKGHTDTVYDVRWSPDGKRLASCSSNRAVRVWDATTGKELHSLEGHTDLVSRVRWSSDGKWLASCSSDETVRVWNAETGKELHRLEGHWGGVQEVEWSPDGKRLASCSRNSVVSGEIGSKVEVRIWRTDTWEPLAVINGLQSSGRLLSWHPHLPLLITPGQRKQDLFIWQLDLEYLLHKAPDPETVRYRNAKVVLVGDSGVGKSGLALVLNGQPFAPTDSTHGRHVWLLDKQEVSVDDRLHETRETWLWDLAGQQDYRLIHQLHLHEATVALIVFDPACDTDPFAGVRHWYRALRLAQQAGRSGTLPLTIFLVAARMDRGSRSVSQARIDDLRQELGYVGYVETSAKNGRGIAELGQIIRAALNWTALPAITSTKLLQAIKMFIRHEQGKGQPLYTVSELYQAFLRSSDAPFPDDKLRQQFDATLDRLAALGDVRWLRFGNLILLQPERLDAYASALLIAAKDEPDGLGYISEECVRQGLFAIPQENRLHNCEQEQLLLIAMIDELVRQELALREGGSLLFPSQSTCEHLGRAVLMEKQAVMFTFAGPVLSIYTTLVVRLAHCGIFQKQGLWQHVVTYTTSLGGTYGLLLSLRGEEGAELGLFFDESAHEEMCFHFENFVRTHLERHARGTVQRRRCFVCPVCGKVFSEADVTYRQSHSFTFIRCICDTEVPLLDGEQRLAASSNLRVREMEQMANTQRDRESAATIQQGNVIIQERSRQQLHTTGKSTPCINIYISCAAMPEDQTLLCQLENQLSMVRRQADIRFWDKRSIIPGANRQDEIVTHIKQAHLILLLLSPDFLGSDECYAEMEQAARRRDAGEAHVIALLLRPTADWQKTPIGKLEPLPADREPVSKRADREEALRDIAQQLRRVIEGIRQDLSSGNNEPLRTVVGGDKIVCT